MTYNENIFDSLTEQEKTIALNILKEYQEKGNSKLLNELKYQDYDEIPVDIETFLKDPNYLGKGLIDDEGRFTVFPYWVEVLKKVFPDPLKPAQYNTLALTGSIGIGKSFEAVLTGLYELYRMLCLKDPYLYYGLQPIDKITFAFMNITLDASKGVAWDKCQQLLQKSPWFMSKGTLSGTTNLTWNPPKGIELIAGSLSRHIIGRAVFWCLDGDTEILTSQGNIKLKDAVEKDIQVYNINENGEVILSDICTVLPTAIEKEEYQIELDDGTIIKCTPSHRFMLTDGSYKEAKYLSENDNILEFIPVGYVYKVTNNINGHIYIGKKQSSTFDNKYLGSAKRQKYEIAKYGKENFTVEILQWAKSLSELKELEEYHISKYFDLNECINLKRTSEGGDTNSNTIKITNNIEEKHIPIHEAIPEGWHIGSKTLGIPHPSKKYKESWTLERRQLMSLKCRGAANSQYGNGEAHRGNKNGRYGKPCPEHVKLSTKESNVRWIYIYDNIEYFGRSELINYLNTLKYQIKATGIERAINGINKTYPELNNKIIKKRRIR